MKKNKIQQWMQYDYPIEIRKLSIDEGGGVLVSIPELGKDTFVADGSDFNEALKNLDEIKLILFKIYEKKGVEIPPPLKNSDFSGKFVLRIPPFMHRELAEQASRNDLSLNSYCQLLLARKSTSYEISESLERLNYKIENMCSELQRIYTFVDNPTMQLKLMNNTRMEKPYADHAA